jgi:hypothetical protein
MHDGWTNGLVCQLLKSREGVSYDRGTPEDMAESRRVVAWLESPKSQEAKKYVAEALVRILEGATSPDGGQSQRASSSPPEQVKHQYPKADRPPPSSPC